jgi:integrating conjugative element protein (TIGR03759 family)
MKKSFKKIVIWGSLFSLLLLINAVYGQAVNNTGVQNTAPLNTTTNNTKSISPEEWDLTTEEWQQYLHLMQGKYGHWYSQLSPPEILGLHADNLQDQTHFAEIVAKQEHDKLARELIFNNEVYQAMQRLYVHEPMIKSFDLSPYNPMHNTKIK